MARPSNKEQRTEQILDAFESCVAKYGVEGSTLEKIAETAGLARPLIRHHIGNKELLLDALVKRMIVKSDWMVKEMVNMLPQKDIGNHLVELLFDSRYSDQQLILVFGGLILAATDRPQLAVIMNRWVTEFIGLITHLLKQEFPKTNENTLSVVATGITGLYFNVDSLSALKQGTKIRSDSKSAARLLLATLK